MMAYEDEDDDEFQSGRFEDGYWQWSDRAKQLIFVKEIDLDNSQSDLKIMPSKIRHLQFKMEVDVLEEQWFRNHFQRAYRENDVVTLQDIKDVVFFTAPKKLLTHDIINVLHLRPIDRFLRALIFYCQYYLQISIEIAERSLQLQHKIKTLRSQHIEDTYQDNLQDLRLLLAKEYCALILGTGKYRKYHHMRLGATQSMTRKDSTLFETILQISIQIVKIALGRKSFEQIELEVHRLFKSNTFNIKKHKLKTTVKKDISKAEHDVLFGSCEMKENITTIRSPLSNEMTCAKHDVDYRLMGIGTTEFPALNERLLYFKRILSSPEKDLAEVGLSLGIIGMPRDRFDTMLREIKRSSKISSVSMRGMSTQRSFSIRSSEMKSRFAFEGSKLYQDIILPDKHVDNSADLPEVFPGKLIPKRQTKNEQREKWLRYSAKIKREKMKRNAHKKRICL